MAKELEPIERKVVTPIVNTGNNTAYAKMGESIGKLTQILGTQLSNQAAYQSGLAGQQAALEGRAPQNLAFPLTKATAAYNDAVVKIETNQLLTEGRNQILEAYTQMADKSKFSEQTPALFKARLEGIESGILEAARPENRGAVKQGLDPVISRVQLGMLNESISYDNEKVLSSLKRDLDKAQKIRDEAYSIGNKDAVAEANRNIGDILESYRKLSKQVEDKLPEITAKLNESATIAEQVGAYMAAREAGEAEKFLAGYGANKPEGLTTEQHFTALQKMLAMQNTFNSADSANQALAKQIIQNDMINPYSPDHISSLESLQSHPAYEVLTPFQQQQVFGAFLQNQMQENTRADKITKAMRQISLGQAAKVDKGVINEIFDSRLKQFEEITGTQAPLEAQFSMVQELDTNVPDFDKIMNAKLTSMIPAETMAAGRLYSTAVLGDKENLISLSKDAQAIAQKMTTLLNGTDTPSEDAIKGAINQVMKVSDSEVKERYKAATTFLEKNGPALYKQLFDATPDPFMDHGAYFVMKEAFLNAYDSAGNQEEAIRMTKNAMRGAGKSIWFEKNEIGWGAPEREFPLSAGTYNVRNQVVTGLDYIVKANNELVTSKNGKYKMKLYGPPVPEKYSADDYVFRPLGYSDTTGTTVATAIGPISTPAESFFSPDTPVPIEVNGVKSDIVLKSNRQTRARGEGFVYGVFAKDKFGVYQQLPNPKSEDGLAYIVLNDLDKINPAAFGQIDAKRLKAILDKSQEKQLHEAMKYELRQWIGAAPDVPNKSRESRRNAPKKEGPTLQELQDILQQNE